MKAASRLRCSASRNRESCVCRRHTQPGSEARGGNVSRIDKRAPAFRFAREIYPVSKVLPTASGVYSRVIGRATFFVKDSSRLLNSLGARSRALRNRLRYSLKKKRGRSLPSRLAVQWDLPDCGYDGGWIYRPGETVSSRLCLLGAGGFYFTACLPVIICKSVNHLPCQ